VPQRPQDFGWPVQAGPSADEPLLEAKTENFFESFFDLQCGQGVPSHWDERTSTSLSRPQESQ